MFLEATRLYTCTHAQDAAFPQAVVAPIKRQLAMSNRDERVCRLVLVCETALEAETADSHVRLSA